ncbi:TetR/AcrR family transcriptional regulator [Celeribacter baekdonensis]|uniref:TetR/AcrR family transcriptional regulator n=1 Tax=Celeribacter baekdonensis TaxID=875171 RepID=UPI003A8D8504
MTTDDDQKTDPDPHPAASSMAKCRRHAAGEDPVKRDQILKGAMKEFMENGFDATSMNEICRTAGVSKGTIYVYFADKVDLFEALIAEERDKIFVGIEALLEEDIPLKNKLTLFGQKMVEILCSDRVIRSQRIVAGIVDRMPAVGARFYDSGAVRTQMSLAALFEREHAAGRILIPDAKRAGVQFVELATAGLWRARLFGKRTTAPTSEEMNVTVEAAVDMFLRAYGARPEQED